MPSERRGRKCPSDGPNLPTSCLGLPFLGASFPPWVLGRCLTLIDSEEFFLFQKTAENWEIRVLFPLLMLNRFAQTHPTYSTALGQNLGLAPGVKFVMGSVFPAAALEAGQALPT